MVSVNIVTSDRGWILERLASELTSRLDYVHHTDAPDPDADINYAITYSCWAGRVSRIEIGWFAHLEPAGEAHDKFFAAAASMDHCLTQARLYEDLLRERGIAHVSTLSPGVDLDRFAPRLKVGVVGRAYHTGRKGEHLVGQLTGMPEIDWHFTGAGWPGPALELADEALPQFYRDMDYILVPSLYEGGPMCVIEALASGTEVISSPVGWVPDLPHIGFRTGDVDDLRRVLLDLYARKQKLRDSVLSRTWDAWAQGHHELFQALAAKHPDPTVAGGRAAGRRTPRVHVGRAGLLMHGNEATSQGGPSVRVPRTARELNKTGVRAEALSFNDSDLTRFDIVHTFNVWSPRSALKALRQARRQAKVSVFSPIFLDLSERPFWDRDLLDVFRQHEGRAAIDGALGELARAWSGVRRNPALAEEPMGGYFAMVREMVALADHLVLLSDKERALLQAIGAELKSWSIVHNPTDNAAFKAADPGLFGETYGFKDFVLCVGRVEARKNQLMLAHALRDTGIPLVLIGHTPSKEYRELIERHGGENVHFLGRLQAGSDLLLSAFRAARVATLPSWSEGAPLAALEAAAAGAALVLSDRSSEPEYFGALARTVDPADPRAIREAILEAYESPPSAEARDAQVAFVEAHFSWATYTAKTKAVYETAIATAAAPAPVVLASRPAPASARQRILFDVTTTVNRTGRVTGIARVELSLALELAARPDVDIRFVHWDNRGRRFIEIPLDALAKGSLDAYRDPAETHFDADIAIEPGAHFIMAGSGWMQNAVYAEGMVAFAQTKGAALTVVVHDLIPVLFPHWFNDEYVPVFERNMRVVLSNADRIGAISQTTRRDVEAVLRRQIDADIDVFTFREGDEIGDFEAAGAGAGTPPPGLERFAGTDFVIAVGAIHARKNHKLLYDVWVRLGEQLGGRCPMLLIIGGVAWNGTDLARAIKGDKRLHGRIALLDDVDDVGLDWLYRNCLFTAYPSLYEGWGLPVCESLRYGKICLASNASSIQEIAPDVTDLLDPLDFSAWATRIRFYATSAGARKEREATIRKGYRPTPWAEAAADLSAKLRAPLGPNRERARYHLGAPLSFTAGSNLRRHARGAWHISESWGAWTAGETVGLAFTLPTRPVDDLVLAMKVKALPPAGGEVVVEVVVNGQRAATWAFHNQQPQIRFVLIDRNAVDAGGGLEIAFTNGALFAIAATTSASADRRTVGMGVAAAVLTETTRAAGLRAMLDPKGECDEAIRPGERFSLLDGRRAARMLAGGWQRSSAWGLWPGAPDARLYVSFDSVPPRTAKLRLAARAAGTPAAPMRIGLMANGIEVTTWQVAGSDMVELDALIPASVQAIRQPVELTLVPANPASPRERGIGQEERTVSLGLFEIAETSEAVRTRPAPASIPSIALGEAVPLKAGGTSRSGAPAGAFLQRGWYGLERTGVWSRGTTGELAFRLDRVPDHGVIVYLAVRAFGVGPDTPARLSIAINERAALDQRIGHEGATVVALDVHPQDVEADRVVWLTLACDRALAPSAAGASTDDRLLGIQVASIETESGLVVRPFRACDASSRSAMSDAFVDGWHPAEQSGRWSKPGEARLRCVVDARGAQTVTLVAGVRIYGSSIEGSVAVEVLSHGEALTTLTFVDDESQRLSLAVPLREVGGKAVLDLSFRRHGAVSPASLGFAGDERELGLWLGSFELHTSEALRLGAGGSLDLLDPQAAAALRGPWEQTAGWGIWPASGSSSLVLALDPALAPDPASLRLTLRPVATPERQQSVEVFANGERIAAWHFADDALRQCRLDLPDSAEPGRPVEIRLVAVAPAAAPADLSLGDETRPFAVGLRAVEIAPAWAGPPASEASLPVLGLGEALAIHAGASARTGAPIEAFLAGGWTGLDRSGAWSRGRAGRLAFVLDQPVGGAMLLAIGMRAMAHAGDPVETAIAINGTALAARAVADGVALEVTALVPQDCVGADGVVSVAISTGSSGPSPGTAPDKDDRRPGLQVTRLRMIAVHKLDVGRLYESRGERRLADFCAEGWHGPEASGIWSRGEHARLVASLDGIADGPLLLTATIRIFGTDQGGPVEVDLFGPGGEPVDVWTFRTDHVETRVARMPVRAIGSVSILDLTFRRRGATSPAAFGLDDERVLGVWLSSLALSPAPVSTRVGETAAAMPVA